LRLICGAIDPKFAGELIEFLINLEIDTKDKNVFSNLFFAADLLKEVTSRNEIVAVSEKLLSLVKRYSTYHQTYLHEDGNNREFYHVRDVQGNAVNAILQTWQNHSETLTWLQNIAQAKEEKLGSIRFLKYHAIVGLAENWADVPENFNILRNCTHDRVLVVRLVAIKQLSIQWKEHPETIHILKERAKFDEHPIARVEAIQALISNQEELPELLDFFHDIILHEFPFENENLKSLKKKYNAQKIVLEALLDHYPTHPKTIALLRDRALNDPDEQLREWAQEQLKNFT
jgi:hypothetical protein